MERFIPVEIFRKKVIPFEVLSYSRFYQNDRNFLYQSRKITLYLRTKSSFYTLTENKLSIGTLQKYTAANFV